MRSPVALAGPAEDAPPVKAHAAGGALLSAIRMAAVRVAESSHDGYPEGPAGATGFGCEIRSLDPVAIPLAGRARNRASRPHKSLTHGLVPRGRPGQGIRPLEIDPKTRSMALRL